ncbi:hypothetical protein CSKR_108675 [Clonorchis sinensis]|uniref:Uncharacterized protein n=1 Tax=Clonorchis sinensis TaxID=79923 RepID=A0A419Q055_CLOSI|nr:hypothetical protein CSKR_108675 [Clonorchis sinensis]
MNTFRHDSFLAPGFSHHYDPKTSDVLAELRESFTEMDEEDWNLPRKRQFTRQRHEDKRKFLVSLRPWMDDKLAVSIPSEEDDNRPDYRYTGSYSCKPNLGGSRFKIALGTADSTGLVQLSLHDNQPPSHKVKPGYQNQAVDHNKC